MVATLIFLMVIKYSHFHKSFQCPINIRVAVECLDLKAFVLSLCVMVYVFGFVFVYFREIVLQNLVSIFVA